MSLNALAAFEDSLRQLNKTSLGRRAFLASVPVLLAACASDGHRTREGDNSGQETELTIEDEKKMTREALPGMQRDYPPLQDAEVQAYVSSIGNRMVNANGLANHPYRYSFTVVDVPMVNAFALPAGTVFVTMPLISMVESEAELAGVIGHEIGHVKARHVAERLEAQKHQSGKSWLYGIGGGLLGGAAGFGIGQLLCPAGNSGCVASATALGAAAGVGGGLLVQKYKFMANSREDEMEADRIGFRAAVKSGYSPSNAGSFYAKLLQMEEKHEKTGSPIMSSVTDAMATHPPSKERVAQINELIASTPKSPRVIVSSIAFERAQAKLLMIKRSRPQPTS